MGDMAQRLWSDPMGTNDGLSHRNLIDFNAPVGNIGSVTENHNVSFSEVVTENHNVSFSEVAVTYKGKKCEGSGNGVEDVGAAQVVCCSGKYVQCCDSVYVVKATTQENDHAGTKAPPKRN